MEPKFNKGDIVYTKNGWKNEVVDVVFRVAIRKPGKTTDSAEYYDEVDLMTPEEYKDKLSKDTEAKIEALRKELEGQIAAV